MDRRQLKTRAAIFDAFIKLISEKHYNKITIQEIIDEANIGRSTFYSHFQTKDELLDAMCSEVFHHIVEAGHDASHTHGHSQHEGVPNSSVCHILQHIKENDHNILTLLSCEGNEHFLKYFKDHINELMYTNFIQYRPKPLSKEERSIPDEFILNHISGAFVEMVQWWISGGLKESPEMLDEWFTSVIIKGC